MLIRALAGYFAERRCKRPSDELGMAADQTEGDDASARSYAATLLAEARDELSRADQKASILLAGAGVALGSIVSGMIGSDWRPSVLNLPWSVTWTIGAVLGIAGVCLLFAAVYPRTRRGVDDEAQIFYFEHALRIGSVADLADALRRSSDHTFTRSADQLWRISRVVNTKYAYVRRAIWLLLAGGLMALTSSFLGST